MSVKQSLLALLGEQPRHGYELKSEFDRRTGNSWPLNIGQVYTTLERLERDGLVLRGDEDADGRVVYRLTEAGRGAVDEWFASPVTMNNPPRNELAIKIALAVTLPDVDVTGLIQTQRRASVESLQNYIRARRQADPDDLAWQLVIESLIHAADAEIRWLDHCESAAVRAARRGRRSTAPVVAQSDARTSAQVPADEHTRPTSRKGK
ncbi:MULTISPECIES: PadR family transcriptional regulator [unclassified Luteococcus]|uniref:PadR family transcriptional regulator n=1 Tax=unclassified Luteococcus TaxID=2639923 RepID=UPI00313ED3E5